MFCFEDYKALEDADTLYDVFDELEEGDLPEREHFNYVVPEIMSEKYGEDSFYTEEANYDNLCPELPEIDFEWNEDNKDSIRKVCPKNFFDKIGMKGKGRDSWTNGLYMPSDDIEAGKCKKKFFHRGSHDNYNSLIEKHIQRLEDQLSKGRITEQEAFNSVRQLQEAAKRFLSTTSKKSIRLN